MAHMIEGNRAFYVKKPAWHNIGAVLPEAIGWEPAWQLIYPEHLYKEPLQSTITRDGQTMTMKIDGYEFIWRSDGKEIGPVTKGYELVQPKELFMGFKSYIDQNLVKLESGGSLAEGKRAWVLGKVDGAIAEILPNDPVECYVLAATGFDGSMSYIEMLTNVRVVCQNTLSLATDSKKGMYGMRFKFRHTKNIRTRIANAKEEIANFLKQFQASVDSYKAMAAKKMTEQEMKLYITSVFITEAMVKEFKEEKKEPSPQLITKINRVIDLLDSQDGLDLVPAAKGTAWQAYNAITQYLTHEQGRNETTRLNAQWFGTSADINSRAFQLALN